MKYIQGSFLTAVWGRRFSVEQLALDLFSNRLLKKLSQDVERFYYNVRRVVGCLMMQHHDYHQEQQQRHHHHHGRAWLHPLQQEVPRPPGKELDELEEGSQEWGRGRVLLHHPQRYVSGPIHIEMIIYMLNRMHVKA